MDADVTLERRVAAGAAWLDARKPGWERLVDLDRLEMDQCSRCILGQTLGDFSERPPEWRFTNRAAELGFDVDEETPAVYQDVEYEELALHWQRLILARRGGGRG